MTSTLMKQRDSHVTWKITGRNDTLKSFECSDGIVFLSYHLYTCSEIVLYVSLKGRPQVFLFTCLEPRPTWRLSLGWLWGIGRSLTSLQWMFIQQTSSSMPAAMQRYSYFLSWCNLISSDLKYRMASWLVSALLKKKKMKCGLCNIQHVPDCTLQHTLE